MSKTKIEWAEETINPFAGCSKVSPGCDNCYALMMAWRLANNPSTKIADKYRGTVEKVDGKVRWTGSINKDLDCMEHLYNGRKGKILFVGSMGDIGHENLHLDLFSAIMEKCYSINNHRIHCSDGKKEPHKFLFLTKRPDRFKALWEMYFKANDIEENRDNWQAWPLSDDVYSTFWLGVTAENQEEADARIPVLLSIPAAKRFVSIEPMLGSVDLLKCYEKRSHVTHSMACTAARLDLVICGGESGPGALPVHPDWVRGVRDQCKDAGVPFFFKQWGEWATPAAFCEAHQPPKKKIKPAWLREDGVVSVSCMPYSSDVPKEGSQHRWMKCGKVGKKDAGRMLDGKEYLEWPE